MSWSLIYPVSGPTRDAVDARSDPLWPYSDPLRPLRSSDRQGSEVIERLGQHLSPGYDLRPARRQAYATAPFLVRPLPCAVVVLQVTL